MLVLTRMIGQSIIIGDDIVITVLGGSPRSVPVKLGIQAPKDIRVDRTEVRERILAEADKMSADQ
jgi:carbon storage regulator